MSAVPVDVDLYAFTDVEDGLVQGSTVMDVVFSVDWLLLLVSFPLYVNVPLADSVLTA